MFQSALNLAGHLCSKYDNSKEKVIQILDFAEIRMVPIVNPDGHKLVMEEGDLCHRTNGRNVDLNRNWGDHWVHSSTLEKDTFGGNEPFSEPETQLLKEDATQYKPDVFLTIHSGTLGLFTPWAYKHSEIKDPVAFIENSKKYPSLISMETRYFQENAQIRIQVICPTMKL